MPDVFYMLEVAAVVPAGETFADRVAARTEHKRRTDAMMKYLKASGHRYLKRSNAFETQLDAEQMILRMGLPYSVRVCKASWAF